MPSRDTVDRFVAAVEQGAHAQVIADFYTTNASMFEFDWLDGSTTRMEEIAYQVWDGELIAQERFFYDPSQMRPVKS